MKVKRFSVIRFPLLITMLIIPFPLPLFAGQGPSFSGFFSQSYILTSDNKFFGDTNTRSGDWGVLELGVNTRWEIDSRMAVAGQLIYRDSGKATGNEYEIDYAFFEYKLLSSLEGEAGVRIGRTRFEHGLYNTTREIPTARPSIILPQEVYFDRARNFLRYQDGVEIFWKRVGQDYLESVAGGIAWRINSSDDATETYYLGSPQPGRYETRDAYTLMWDRQYTNGWRYRITNGYGLNDYIPSPDQGDIFPEGNSRSYTFLGAVQYDDQQHWRYTSEFMVSRAQSKEFDPILPDLDTQWYGAYFQTTYFTEHYELFARYGQYWIEKRDRQVLLELGLPNKTLYSKGWALGGRYYLRPNLFFAAEAHYTQGNGWLSHVENPNVCAQVENWNMYLMEIGVTF